MVRRARQDAVLSQRALATMTGTPRSTISRIETGLVDPRSETLERLLRACRHDIEPTPALGEGIDRSLIREYLALSPTERIARLATEARFLTALDRARERIASNARRSGRSE